MAASLVRESLPWALAHATAPSDNSNPAIKKVAKDASLRQLFLYASWQDKRLLALNQAGLVEKFTDALVWIILPVWFLSQGLTLIQGSSIIGVYGLVWGGAQMIPSPASDRYGRKPLIVGGMWFCGIGVLLLQYTTSIWLWSVDAAVIGFGMAMLYPTLGAAVADISPPAQRSSLLGVYRFWRDLGYAVGALLMGLLAQYSQVLEQTFWLVGVAMLASGLVVLVWFEKDKQGVAR